MAIINIPEFITVSALIIAFGLLIPTWAVSFRRLHDTGRSAWYMLWTFVPYLGGIILLVIFCQKSDEDNKYGPNPKMVEIANK